MDLREVSRGWSTQIDSTLWQHGLRRKTNSLIAEVERVLLELGGERVIDRCARKQSGSCTQEEAGHFRSLSGEWCIEVKTVTRSTPTGVWLG